MIDFKTIGYFTGAQAQTEFADLLDNYIRKMRADGWSILFEFDIYDEPQSVAMKKPTFENRMALVKIT